MIKKVLSVIGTGVFLLAVAVAVPIAGGTTEADVPACGGIGAACW